MAIRARWKRWTMVKMLTAGQIGTVNGPCHLIVSLSERSGICATGGALNGEMLMSDQTEHINLSGLVEIHLACLTICRFIYSNKEVRNYYFDSVQQCTI